MTMDAASLRSRAGTRLKVGCKLNLYLEITGILSNGYHSLETLFYFLPEPHDFIDLAPGKPGQAMRLFCPQNPELESEQNILIRAYKLFAEHTGRRYDLTVTLHKQIPMGAGLGGGSADGAALLLWLNSRENLLSSAQLLSLAARLGADVSFFMLALKDDGPRAAWGQGIGEKLTPADVSALAGLYLLLIFPGVPISTPWAYAAWDKLPIPQNDFNGFFATEHLTSAGSGDMKPLAHALRLYNSFEAVVFPEYPALRLIKERLLQNGAAAAMMSGSGSTVFGLFKNADAAENTACEFKRESYKYLLQQL